MEYSGLQDITLHINSKISAIRKCLQLRKIGQEQNLKSMLKKIRQEITHLFNLLNEMEHELHQQGKLKNMLEELQKCMERQLNEAQHIHENIPCHLLKPTQSCIVGLTVQCGEQTKAVESKCTKRPMKEPRAIKEVALITVEEFNNIPGYMKGRLTSGHINSVILDINKAVLAKYKIVHQPLKSLNSKVRSLYYRFMEEETKETKGEFFIVEEDIKEFTQLKVDKCFHRITNILRHCRKLKEVRGSKLVRYIIC